MNVMKKHQEFLDRVKSCVTNRNIWRYMLSEVIFEIKQAFPRYAWVGFYLVDNEELVLETFLGKPTEHVRIPLDKGICGASASLKQTMLIKDVKKDERYISCDIDVKSELVIPMIYDHQVIGVLDIDSNYRNVFTEYECKLLEEIVKWVADAFPGFRKK